MSTEDVLASFRGVDSFVQVQMAPSFYKDVPF